MVDTLARIEELVAQTEANLNQHGWQPNTYIDRAARWAIVTDEHVTPHGAFGPADLYTFCLFSAAHPEDIQRAKEVPGLRIDPYELTSIMYTATLTRGVDVRTERTALISTPYIFLEDEHPADAIDVVNARVRLSTVPDGLFHFDSLTGERHQYKLSRTDEFDITPGAAKFVLKRYRGQLELVTTNFSATNALLKVHPNVVNELARSLVIQAETLRRYSK